MEQKLYTDLEIGEALPDLAIDITPRLIVGGAIASRDFQNVHHDYHAATDTGTENIFMNILTTNGLVGRYVTDWAGPEAALKEINIRLGVPNYPGDQMVLSGEIAAKEDGECVRVDIKGKNSQGYHVTGDVLVSFPGAGAES